MARALRDSGKAQRNWTDGASQAARESLASGEMEPPQYDRSGAAAETARFLARNTVDCLPEGALERKLAEGRPLRVKLGVDPTAPDIHLGFTRSCCRSCASSRMLGHTRRADHRRLHRARGGSERPLDTAARAPIRPRSTPTPRTFQEQALKVLDPDPERLEVRFNGEWLDMSMARLFALMRTTTVGQILERDDFSKRYAARPADLDARAALPAAAGL